MEIECLGCASRNVVLQGHLPQFLSDNLDGHLGRLMERGCLYRCCNCSLQFRSPTPSQQILNEYYHSITSDGAWDYDDSRPEWRYIKLILAETPKGSLLDVGCFRGDLLVSVGDGWRKYGIEMSAVASTSAEKRGITIIGSSIEEVTLEAGQFKVITMIDVIEHLSQPVEALRKLTRGLSRGGKLIISTGNTQSLSYLLSGARYYYGAFAEHITFYSPQWFRWLAPNLGCAVESVYKFSHNPANIERKVNEALINTAYVLYRHLAEYPALDRILQKVPKVRNIAKWENCWWTSAKDHMLIVLSKQD